MSEYYFFRSPNVVHVSDGSYYTFCGYTVIDWPTIDPRRTRVRELPRHGEGRLCGRCDRSWRINAAWRWADSEYRKAHDRIQSLDLGQAHDVIERVVQFAESVGSIDAETLRGMLPNPKARIVLTIEANHVREETLETDAATLRSDATSVLHNALTTHRGQGYAVCWFDEYEDLSFEVTDVEIERC